MSDSINITRAALAAGMLSIGAIGTVGFLALKPAPYQSAPAPRQIHLAELIGMKYPLAKTIEVLAAPEAGAPSITRVRQGSEVMVTGVVDGEGWYQLALPDQQLGYVQAAAIPAASATAPPPAPAVSPAMPAVPAPVASDPTAPPAPDLGAPPLVQVPPVVDFDEAHEVRQVVNPTAVYLKPDRLAPEAYPVGPGRQVYVIALSKDGNWAWVDTADNAPAYIPMSDIGQ
jgi:hypothetical protein